MYGFHPRPTVAPPVPLAGKTYFNTFAVDENPVSGVVQLDPTNTMVKSVSGACYGTQVSGGPFAPFDDSCAEVRGFGPNYEVTATIIKAGGLDTVNREVEIRLRCSSDGPLITTAFGDTHSNGYEIAVQHNGNYMNLGRWKAANLVGPISGFGTPATGDKFRARIEGQRIRVWYNDVSQIDFTDNDAALQIVRGNPGWGFFINAGPPFPGNTDFGFSDILIVQLP